MAKLVIMKKYIRYLLPKNRLRISRSGLYSIFDFESILYRHLAFHKTLTFFQIGAKDGIMNDPVGSHFSKNY
jgi:hypothetical protein